MPNLNSQDLLNLYEIQNVNFEAFKAAYFENPANNNEMFAMN